jgi:hypothetical protein
MTKRRLNVEMLDSDSASQAIEIVGRLADANGISWAVCGGLAMIVYGSPRLTKDVDIIASRRLPLPPDIVATPLKQGGEHFQVKTDKQSVKTDWIVRNDAFKQFYQAALEEAACIDGLPVITPEYLVLLKYIAGRFKDQEDAVYLLRQKGLVKRRQLKEIVNRVRGRDAWLDFYVGLSRWFDIADRFLRDGDENESYRTEDEYLDI